MKLTDNEKREILAGFRSKELIVEESLVKNFTKYKNA